jgi:myo-inositol-1(or 4)-monophosphatase
MMPSNTLHPMLNVAIKAARAAGSIINRAALDVESVRVAEKNANDFVTEVDQASEEAIIQTLLGAYPDHGILAEESGQAHGNPQSEFVWIIDPLDGTTNFIHGFPYYCVSIAMQFRGKIEQAVVYDPTRNDLFSATKGRGAFMNDRRMRVSKRTHLKDCLLSTGFPFRQGDDLQTYLLLMAEMIKKTAALRRPGAAALDLAYVAAGFSDGFFESGLQPWDTAAGSLLITEAGGLIGNFSGEANFLHEKECMAGSPKIYAQMAHLLSPYSKVSNLRHPDASLTPEKTGDTSTPTDETNDVVLAALSDAPAKRIQRLKGTPMSIKPSETHDDTRAGAAPRRARTNPPR